MKHFHFRSTLLRATSFQKRLSNKCTLDLWACFQQEENVLHEMTPH